MKRSGFLSLLPFVFCFFVVATVSHAASPPVPQPDFPDEGVLKKVVRQKSAVYVVIDKKVYRLVRQTKLSMCRKKESKYTFLYDQIGKGVEFAPAENATTLLSLDVVCK